MFQIFTKLPNRYILILTGLFSIFLYWPGITQLPPMDRDASRFAQATKQMLETGCYSVPYFQECRRTRKPLGIYHLQSLSAKFLDPNSIVSYRVPSFLFSVLSAVCVAYFFLTILPRKQTLVAMMAYLDALDKKSHVEYLGSISTYDTAKMRTSNFFVYEVTG